MKHALNRTEVLWRRVRALGRILGAAPSVAVDASGLLSSK
jgi:hypothetical protein